MLHFPVALKKELNQIVSVILENCMFSVFPKLPSVFHIVISLFHSG